MGVVASSFLRFLDHTQRNTHNDALQSVKILWTSDQLVAETSTDNTKRPQQTDIHAPAGFQPAIQTSQQPQVYVLDRAATGTGIYVPYSLLNAFWVTRSRRLKLADYVARLADRRRVYRVLVGRPKEKRPLRTRWCKWEDNIKMDLQDVRYVCMDLIFAPVQTEPGTHQPSTQWVPGYTWG
jgi:hypothetical protein